MVVEVEVELVVGVEVEVEVEVVVVVVPELGDPKKSIPLNLSFVSGMMVAVTAPYICLSRAPEVKVT